MKTYEEMAQSVLRRAKAHKTVRNRWIVGSVAAVLALSICVCALVIKPTDQPEEQLQAPVETTEPATTLAVPDSAKVTFLYSDGSEISDLALNVETPCRMEIRVKDIRGMSVEEVDALREAEAKYAEELVEAHPEAKGYQWGQCTRINTLITCISAGHIIIATEHPEWIDNIYAKTQGMVKLDHMEYASDDYMKNPTPYLPDEYALNHDQIQQQYYTPYGGLEIACGITSRAEMALDEGTVTLGQLRDTITFLVTYVDGTAEEHTIDMIFNESGEVYALYCGVATAA